MFFCLKGPPRVSPFIELIFLPTSESKTSPYIIIPFGKKFTLFCKKSISNFKTRKNTNAGLKVTLRKNKMYEFIDRLINIALPRIRDFRGLSPNSFDKFGNYTFGIKEHIIFPEIDYDKIDKVKGMDITIVTSTKKNNEAKSLLKAFNFPLNK